MKKTIKRSSVCNYISAVLMLALLILQFMPFWNYGGNSVSIQGYVWFPTNNPEIESYFRSALGVAPDMNNTITVPVLQLVSAIAGIVLCTWKSKIHFTALLPAICGIGGIYGFLTKPVFRLGSTWIVQLILCIFILIVSVATMIAGAKESKLDGNSETEEDKAAYLQAIEAIENIDEDKNLFRVLDLLKSENPEYRITACKKLEASQREVAITHLVFYIKDEKNEKVENAMRKALVNIRKNTENR